MVEKVEIKGINERDILKLAYKPLDIQNNIEFIKAFFYFTNYDGAVVYRAFNYDKIYMVEKEGTDRSEEEVSLYDNPDIIYAGSLYKALEYSLKHFRKDGKVCIAVYRSDKLDKIDELGYSYVPKKGESFKDALLRIVTLAKD